MDPETLPNFCKVLICEPRGWYSVLHSVSEVPLGNRHSLGDLMKNFPPFLYYTNTGNPWFHPWQCWTFHNRPNLSPECLDPFWKGFVSHTEGSRWFFNCRSELRQITGGVNEKTSRTNCLGKKRSCWLWDARSFLRTFEESFKWPSRYPWGMITASGSLLSPGDVKGKVSKTGRPCYSNRDICCTPNFLF